MVKVLGIEFEGLKHTASGGIYYVQSSSSDCTEDLLKSRLPSNWRKYSHSVEHSESTLNPTKRAAVEERLLRLCAIRLPVVEDKITEGDRHADVRDFVTGLAIAQV
jgi:hypothetical protein